MPRFTYEARDKQGRTVAGEIEAPNRIQATMQLRAHELWITKLAEGSVGVLEVNLDEPAPRRPVRTMQAARGQWFYALWPVKAAPLRDFFDQLGELLEAGVNIYDAMTVLPGRVNRRLGPILREISPSLAQGQSFADQLARYPYVFSTITVGLMRAGERSGQLGQMCRMLADQHRLDHRVWLGLLPVRLYGWLVIFFAVMVPSLPRIIPDVLAKGMAMGDSYTPLDGLRFAWSSYRPILVHELLPIFLGLVALDWTVRTVLRQPWAAGVRQEVFGLVPGAAGYLRSGMQNRVLSVLEAMVRAGAPYGEALERAAEAAGPSRLGRQLARAAAQVQAGMPLGTAMNRVTSLPYTVRGAMLTAEQAGTNQRTLGRLAQVEQEKLEGAPRRLAISGYLGGLLVFGVITAAAVAVAYRAYFDAILDAGEKLMQ